MSSIHRLSVVIVDSLLKNYEDKKAYRDIYEYGLDIVLSTMCNVFVIIIISLCLGITTHVFWYCLFFLPYRFLFGGIHAKTQFQCIMLTNLCMLAGVGLALNISYTIVTIVFEVLLVIISTGSNFYFAKVKDFARESICILVSVAVLLIINFVWKSYVNGMCAALGMATQAVSFVIKVKRGMRNEQNIQ